MPFVVTRRPYPRPPLTAAVEAVAKTLPKKKPEASEWPFQPPKVPLTALVDKPAESRKKPVDKAAESRKPAKKKAAKKKARKP